jgi:biopolymer transport protein ExbD
MKTLFASLFLLLLTGCQTEVFHSASVPIDDRAAEKAAARTISVEISVQGQLTVDGWSLTTDQLPALVKIRHANAALIEGEPLAPYGKALEVRATLEKAGISDIKIVTLSP